MLQTIQENLQFIFVCIIIIAAIIIVSHVCEATLLKKNIARINRTRYITICGMLGAIAMVLHLLDFPIFFIAPTFYKLDFSEIPVMIGAFCLGPVGGVIIELVKILLKLVIKGTDTAFVGDLANFVIGCSFIVPASIIYHVKKTKTTALIGLVAGGVVMVVFGTMFNALYLLPAFSKLYGLPLDEIVAMGTGINHAISDVTTFVIFCVAPLNIIKSVCIAVPTMILYKRIGNVLFNITVDQFKPARKSRTR